MKRPAPYGAGLFACVDLVVVLIESCIAFRGSLESVLSSFLGLVRTHAFCVRAAIVRFHPLMFQTVVPTHGPSFRLCESFGRQSTAPVHSPS